MRPQSRASGSELDAAALDRAMTADRAEKKLLVAPDLAPEIARELSLRLAPHRFQGKGATILPGGIEYATTIYFDTQTRDLYREATTSEAHLKLRAREYYSVHPSLTELATDPRALVRYTPLLWLELKQKDGVRTTKRRFGLRKHDVARFFSFAVSAGDIELGGADHEQDASRVLDELTSVCRRYRTPLRPDCIVNYRRAAWQDERGGLRVTLDRAVSFYAPPDDLFSREFALVRETLGEPAGSLGYAVMEVKSRGPVPEWLAHFMLDHALVPERFSKFVAASQAVHG